MLLCLFLSAFVGDNGLYGAPITDETPLISIEELMKNPEEFMGQMVRVKGEVTKVCPMKGCWVDIKAGKDKVRIKVKDGEIVFDQKLVGNQVIAEGTVYKFDLTKEEAVGYFKHLAEELGEEFDPASVTEGTTIYQIGGLGVQLTKN